MGCLLWIFVFNESTRFENKIFFVGLEGKFKLCLINGDRIEPINCQIHRPFSRLRRLTWDEGTEECADGKSQKTNVRKLFTSEDTLIIAIGNKLFADSMTPTSLTAAWMKLFVFSLDTFASAYLVSIELSFRWKILTAPLSKKKLWAIKLWLRVHCSPSTLPQISIALRLAKQISPL